MQCLNAGIGPNRSIIVSEHHLRRQSETTHITFISVVMVKRCLEDAEDSHQPAKRVKRSRHNCLDRLSNELLLRTFSYLSVPTLCRCQRVSRRFSAIAGDSQIWKQSYYNRFVRPRAARLPARKDSPTSDSSLYFSSKLSKWLDEANLIKRGKDTNWKRQYKLRDNWARGKCEVTEMDVAEEPPTPKLLVRLHEGVLFTVDRPNGLRAWSAKKERRLLATTALDRRHSDVAATSLAINISDNDDPASGSMSHLAVGFADGSFTLYSFDRNKSVFWNMYRQPPSINGMITAVAYASPYLLTMTSKQLLSLYKLSQEPNQDPPQQLYAFTSQLVRPPLSLCVRQSGSNIIASIAYLVPTLFQGWTVGIQEINLSQSGELVGSRLATASSDQHQSASSSLPLTQSPPRPSPYLDIDSSAGQLHRSRATSVSYSHPYLLLTHADNTLTLHLVTSTTSSLSIGEASRLWGHTSSVSGAHVGGRGKAVSVSSHGDELRVWELEGALSSLTMRKRLSTGQLSVRVSSRQSKEGEEAGRLSVISDAISQRGTGLGLALKETEREMGIMRGWVGFDDENVVVLKERNDGRQALVVYDFT